MFNITCDGNCTLTQTTTLGADGAIIATTAYFLVGLIAIMVLPLIVGQWWPTPKRRTSQEVATQNINRGLFAVCGAFYAFVGGVVLQMATDAGINVGSGFGLVFNLVSVFSWVFVAYMAVALITDIAGYMKYRQRMRDAGERLDDDTIGEVL